MEERLKSQRLVGRLDIVLRFAEVTPWTVVDVGMIFRCVRVLLVTLSPGYMHPFYPMYLCYIVIFFFHRFLTALLTRCSSVANVWKVVFSAV